MNALYVPKDISDELTPYQMDRRAVVKGIIGGFGIAAFGGIELVLDGCATAPLVPLNPGTPNTLSYTDKDGVEQTVYDLKGKWDANYSDGPGTQEVTITQNGPEFTGIKTKGGVYVTQGSPTVKGILEKSGFKEVYGNDSELGWIKSKGKIKNNGDNINISSFEWSINLKRIR